MARIVMWNIVTVDGYFEGDRNWDLPWHEMLSSEDLEAFSMEQLNAAEALLFGRKTYEGMFAYWKTQGGAVASSMNSLKKYVASNTPVPGEWDNTQRISGDIDRFLGDIKKELTGDILILGSSLLSQYLMNRNLIEEYRIGIAPHFHGSGRRLFESGIPKRDLVLTNVRRIRSDGIVLVYEPVKVPDPIPS